MNKHYVSLLGLAAGAAFLAGTAMASAQTAPAPAPAPAKPPMTAPAKPMTSSAKPMASSSMSGMKSTATKTKKPMHHTAMKKPAANSGDADVARLNEMSLQAASSGQTYTPTGSSMPASSSKPMAPMKAPAGK